MSVRRIMGTEVEYGISVPGHPHANSMTLSAQIVNAYAMELDDQAQARWDYEEEHPLRDARGYDMERGQVDPEALTDEDPGLANLILTNGARLYVDHAHPEFSTPEVTDPLDAVVWDKAGELVMLRALRRAATVPGAMPINLYKNNTDNKGASYGTHENYLVRRDVPFASIVRHLTPFFVTRQVICGAGRVGIGQDGREHGFQLSQRADFFEAEVGLETTLKRPIINTRDEPHADPAKYRRFHVIVGDANLSEISTFVKLASTSVVLALIEADAFDEGLELVDPVREIRDVSHDTGLTHLLRLRDGRSMNALQIQYVYLEAVRKFLDDRWGSDTDTSTRLLLERWETLLDVLTVDPFQLADQLDWVAKLKLLEGYRRRDGVGWDHPTLALVDLQYSDIRPEKGLYHHLVRSGRMQRLISDDAVEHAVNHAPEDTRAWFRGECLRRYGRAVVAASWDSLVFDVPGEDSLQRIPTPEPTRGTRAHVEALLDASPDVTSLLAALRA